jgi:hypothetical protein
VLFVVGYQRGCKGCEFASLVAISRKDMTSFPLTKLLCVAGVTARVL